MSGLAKNGVLKCEVCGKPAKVVYDIAETAPRYADGYWWREWRRVGEAHLFCREHRLLAKVTELSDEEREKPCQTARS